MGKVVSETIDNPTNNAQLSVSFELEGRGTEEIVINDESLTTYNACKDRAEAEMLNQSYKHSAKTFSTYHIDDIELGDIVNSDGFIGVVMSIDDEISGAKASMSLTLKAFL